MFIAKWPAYVAVVGLVLAIMDFPYDYYIILRWAITGVSIYYLVIFSKLEDARFWLFIGIAVLFNPIFIVEFPKDTWQLVDIVVACVFAFGIHSDANKKEDELEEWDIIKKRE